MQFSRYTIIVDDFPQAGLHLVYNTRTQALVKITDELRAVIEHFPLDRADVPEPHCAHVKKLSEIGILVEDETVDDARIEDFFHQLRSRRVTDTFCATILTTYACNFACVYCFEESSRQSGHMSMKTADDTIAWIKKTLRAQDYRQLQVIFYGGEPLLNMSILEYITRSLYDFCQSEGIVFKCILQTNGYLLTRDIVEQYLPLGLSQVRISVDGVAAVHDRNRPLRGGGGTFERIIENISACVDLTRIGLAVSYTNGEVEHIGELFEYLEAKGILHKLDEFVCATIHPTLGPQGAAAHIRHTTCLMNYDDHLLVKAVRRINELLRAKGLPVRSGLVTVMCPLVRQHSEVTIDQEGRLYKCNVLLGHEEFSIGDVRSGEFSRQHDMFVNLDAWRKCPRECPYLPMCSGGCRMAAFLESQDFSRPACHREFLDVMIEDFIIQEYERLQGAKK